MPGPDAPQTETKAKEVPAEALGLPSFAVPPSGSANVFGLSSHRRAKEALEFGLGTDEPGFNIFVVGEDRSNRMSATLAFLHEAVAGGEAPCDWLYLNNFRRPHRPKPYRLPAGVGARFRDSMAELVPQVRDALTRELNSEEHQAQIRAQGEAVQREIMQRLDQLKQQAQQAGLQLIPGPQGLRLVAVDKDGEPIDLDDLEPERRQPLEESAETIKRDLGEINRWAAKRQGEFLTWAKEANRQVAESAVGGLLDNLAAEYQSYTSLIRWLVEMRVDLMDHLDIFMPDEERGPAREPPERRYAVNLLVDNADAKAPPVVVEANPTYQNLFGRIEYRAAAHGGLETDFSMVRSGALHRANGGVLVLRAEALAMSPFAWEPLKGALRDRTILLQELHRSGGVPMSEAPRPKAVPLDVKVVIVGAPRWYYTFFSVDPEFQTHFKVKADIDGDMAADPDNLACLGALIRELAAGRGAVACDESAVARLLGLAALLADRRDKLTASFEWIEDVLNEAVELAERKGKKQEKLVTAELVAAAQARRRHRNARTEDRLQEEIARGTILIDTAGSVVGQVNGLTVRSLGDHSFGSPARITARAFIGRRGIINIERDVALGGPIQQKGAMVLQGFLAGHFARRIPLSFNCSITFEQSYGGVEGDSASLAELLAVLSDLAAIPLRQDLAITGSVNQRGQSQAVGGVRHKVAGFFRACVESGGLTGTQGVVVPAANEVNLVLPDEIAEAVAGGRFQVWSVETVEQAIELFTGVPAGEADAEGRYPSDSVYGRAFAQLEEFDRILTERERGA